MKTDRYGKLEFFATCAKGLEQIVAREAEELGLSSIRPQASGVTFRATMKQAMRALLWMRCASRIVMTLDRVAASTSDELYRSCLAFHWEDHIPEGSTIAVFAKGENQALRNSHFTQQRVKDAICDRLRDNFGWRPAVDTRNPDVSIRVNLHNTRATLSLDLAGAPMHMRGYRKSGVQTEAPIKETLAAAILIAGGWKQLAKEGGCLVDPFCGSGTLAIEGAMIACDIAPGIMRERWGIQGWKQFDAELFDEVLAEADDRAEAGMDSPVAIFGSDIDARAIECALENAKRAGVRNKVRFEVSDIANLETPGLPENGLLATNPPYGERLLSQSQLPSLLVALKDYLSEYGSKWSSSIIVADPSIDMVMGSKPMSTIETYNGPISTTIRTYGAIEGSKDNELGQAIDAQGQEFANRLKKMARHRGKWARKNGITCYRVYDADLPDFAMSVDVYKGAGKDSDKTWAYVCEYAAPKSIDPAVATARANAAVGIIRNQFDLGASDVFLKRRVRSKGGSQYGSNGSDVNENKYASQVTRHMISESNHLFYVSFDMHIDTGIFLDGRKIRKIIQDNCNNKRFLNLFAYTGTASVYAAAGGAKSTHTIDMSQTYLDWARQNMELNNFTGKEHTYERADAVQWVTEERHSKNRYDLVYVDPPTFSNSKKMHSRTWDVQRDHAELLIAVSRILTRDGAAIFCCNLRNFKPDVATLAKAGVGLVDITDRTIPEDFERNSKIHHCYIVKRLVKQ